MFTIAIIILFILLFVLLAVLTFARDLLATFLGAIVGIFRRGDRMQKNTQAKSTSTPFLARPFVMPKHAVPRPPVI